MVTAEKTLTLDPRIYKTSVALPFCLWDKLSPDEWKPLIASRLIYHRNFTKKKVAINFSYMVFPYLTIPFSVAIFQILGIIPLPGWAASAGIILWVLAMSLVAKVAYAPFFRGLEHVADKQARELAIAPSLEDVLRKVDTMNVPNKANVRKRLERRLENLHEP